MELNTTSAEYALKALAHAVEDCRLYLKRGDLNQASECLVVATAHHMAAHNELKKLFGARRKALLRR